MGGLVRRTAIAAGAVGTPAARGVAATTDTATFEGRVLTWDDLGDMRIPGPGLVDLVVAQRGALRTPAGLVQARRGIRVHKGGLAMVTVTRPLSRRADGKLTPAGSWGTSDRLAIDGTPRITRATAPIHVDAEVIAEASSARIPTAHADAHEASEFLPAEIVRDLERTIPNPQHYLGEITQAHDLTKQELKLARIAPAAAVVLHAIRRGPGGDLSRTPWTVTRYQVTDTHTRQIGDR